jgi:hypothetical protein
MLLRPSRCVQCEAAMKRSRGAVLVAWAQRTEAQGAPGLGETRGERGIGAGPDLCSAPGSGLPRAHPGPPEPSRGLVCCLCYWRGAHFRHRRGACARFR